VYVAAQHSLDLRMTINYLGQSNRFLWATIASGVMLLYVEWRMMDE
jgi:hypothetical protein